MRNLISFFAPFAPFVVTPFLSDCFWKMVSYQSSEDLGKTMAREWTRISRRILTTDDTDGTDGDRRASSSHPCHPCDPWLKNIPGHPLYVLPRYQYIWYNRSLACPERQRRNPSQPGATPQGFAAKRARGLKARSMAAGWREMDRVFSSLVRRGQLPMALPWAGWLAHRWVSIQIRAKVPNTTYHISSG